MPAERLYLGELHEDDPVRVRHVRRYADAIAAADRGGLWLDCACGSGYGAEMMLAGKARRVIAVDMDSDALDYARKHHGSDRVQHYRLDLQLADRWMRALGPFDAIVSVETLEHVEQRVQARFVDQSARNLARGGAFVLACPIGNGGPNPTNPHHVHEPTYRELMRLLYRNFRSVQISTEDYESTSGPATQALAVCRRPRP